MALMKLTLEMEAELKFCLDEYREHLNKETGSDFTTSEVAVVVLKSWLREKGRLEKWLPEQSGKGNNR